MKKVVFAYGRFNPPTIGHEKLIKAVAKEAGSDDWFIIPSQTAGEKKNPLPYDVKTKYMKLMFPEYADHIDDKACCRTPVDVMKHLMMKEYTDVIMMVGSDRVNDFGWIQKNNRKDDYSFSTIEIKSAGERDPDKDGATGMSASKMREAAKDQKAQDFIAGMPEAMNLQDKMELMIQVRKGMGL